MLEVFILIVQILYWTIQLDCVADIENLIDENDFQISLKPWLSTSEIIFKYLIQLFIIFKELNNFYL